MIRHLEFRPNPDKAWWPLSLGVDYAFTQIRAHRQTAGIETPAGPIVADGKPITLPLLREHA